MQEDPAGLGEVRDALGSSIDSPTVVRVRGPQQLPEPVLHLISLGALRPQAQDTKRPDDGIVTMGGPRRGGPRIAEMFDQPRPNFTPPPKAATDGREHGRAMFDVDSRRCVDRTKHVGLWCSLAQLKHQFLTRADEPMAVRGQPDPVVLEAVTKPRLRDALARFELTSQRGQVIEQVRVDVRDKPGNDAPQEQPAEARSRRGGKHREPDGHPPSGSDRPGLEHLQLGQQHHTTVSARRSISDEIDEASSKRRGQVPGGGLVQDDLVAVAVARSVGGGSVGGINEVR